jgi:hypothetical protein
MYKDLKIEELREKSQNFNSIRQWMEKIEKKNV